MNEVWVLLLRGVNVGGVKLSMAEVRDLLAGMGLEGVQSYIQSGNLVFRGAVTVEALRAAIGQRFGLDLGMILMSLAAYEAVLAACPFAAEGEVSGKSVHVIFVRGAALQPGLEAHATAGERFAMTEGAFYLHAPEGFGTSELVKRLPRHLKGLQTARNWNSCLAVRDLARGLVGGSAD